MAFMKLLRHNRLWALAATLFASSAWGDITVRFDPPDETVGLGDVFTMDIVADITDPVIGWGLDLAIVDPTIVSTVGAPAVGPDWFGAFAPDGDGLVGLAFPNSVSGNSILLATTPFSADPHQSAGRWHSAGRYQAPVAVVRDGCKCGKF